MTGRSLLVAALLVVATLSTGVTAATATQQDTPETVTLDGDNPLASDATADTYESEGVAGGSVAGYDMRLTVADSHDAVGLEGIEYTAATDATNHYLRVQYNESIERTIRFHVDDGVWYPHYREFEAENDNVEASFVPGENSSHTVVELTLTGPTDAVFQVPKVVSGYYYARDSGKGWIENKTGVELPDLFGSSQQWERLADSDLTTVNDTVGIRTNGSEDVMIQYDALEGSGERWVPVPECDSTVGEDAPVCLFERPDDSDHVYVLAQANETPAVRYKHGTDLMSQTMQAVAEFRESIDRIIADLQAAVDGVFG